MGGSRLGFLLARLRKASVAELMHRGTGQVLQLALARGWMLPDSPDKVALALERLNEITIPSTHDATPQGTLKPDPKAVAAFESRWGAAFSAKVPTRDHGADLREVWEPARLQQTVPGLLQHGREDQAIGQVVQWVDDNPFPLGPHYKSVMECGLRIPVFLRAAQEAEVDSAEERAILLRAVYEHAWLISKRLSLHSSLGNHTVAEAMGMVFAGGVFSGAGQGRKWLERGIELLEQECPHQVLADGGPVEQSVSYHRFVLDMFWYSIDYLEQNGLHDCTVMKERLARGEGFWAVMQAQKGVCPAIGDSDEGYVVAPELKPWRQAKQPVPCYPEQGNDVRTFASAGYSVVRTTDRVFLAFDHGLLGMPPLYGHGHADALSITLYKHGVPFLVDPGTFRYNGAPEWRRYFKSTRAHNTVCIDGRNQARYLTGFIWDKPYAVTWESWESEGKWHIRATHDGYKRLKKQVLHTRKLSIDERGELLIEDWFAGKGAHVFELLFHLHPEVSVDKNPGQITLSNHGHSISFAGEMVGQMEVVEGRTDPILGWYSPHYGHKEPTRVLRLVREGRCEDVGFSTQIRTA